MCIIETFQLWYKVEDLFKAWDLFISGASPSMADSSLYRYIVTQCLEVNI